MDKTTYILGAGFSRYAGLPLMNDFFFRSKDLFPALYEEEDIESFSRVFEYFDKFSKVKNIMEADFYNIEELLSIIEMHSFLNEEKQIHRDYLHFITRVIELSSPSSANADEYYIINDNKTTELYTKFLMKVYGISKCYNKKEDEYSYEREYQNDNGIISLNYDMLLEIGLNPINKYKQKYTKSLPAYDFEYGLNDEYIDYKYIAKPIHRKKLKVAKIHGSINFEYNGVPLIVPPTWNKTSNIIMKNIWQLAHKMLSDTNSIVFIGYSLPINDLYVKYLLINGIESCKNLKNIIVICRDDGGGVRKRYEAFFDKNFRNKAFEFLPISFEEWIQNGN